MANPKNKPSSPKSPSVGGIKLFPNARFMVGFTTVLPQFYHRFPLGSSGARERKSQNHGGGSAGLLHGCKVLIHPHS